MHVPQPHDMFAETLSTCSSSATLVELPSKFLPLDLKPLANQIKNKIASYSKAIHIVGLLATDDEGCRQYARSTEKSCLANGLSFTTVNAERFEDVRKKILEMNDDLSVTGLIVYFPLFGPVKDAALRNLISPRIDVEGVNSASSKVFPCTPLAVTYILEHAQISQDNRIQGTVTVVNRSETVGQPLIAMLEKMGARVYSIDISGVYLFGQKTDMSAEECYGESDVIVSAVPGKFKIPTAAVKYGSLCINVATGDNFEEDIHSRAVYVRRMGSITTMMLQLNALNV